MEFILSVILTMLKIIGILLLALICIVLLLLIIVLFSKIKYTFIVNKSSDDFDLMSTTGKVHISWISRIVNFKLIYKDKIIKYIVTIFGFKAMSSSINLDKTKSDDDDTSQYLPDPVPITYDNDTYDAKFGDLDEDDSYMGETDEILDFSKNSKNKKKTKDKKQKKSNESKNKENIPLIYLKDIKVMRRIFRSIKKILCSIKPKIFKIKGTIGMEDPSITGKILGVAYILKGSTGFDISLKGDFQRQIIKGDLYIKGSFSIWNLIFPLLWIIIHELKRRFFNLKIFKKNKK